MEQTTLKYLRILIPGLIILLGLYPIFEYKYSEFFDLKTLDTTYITFISLMFGGIYYQLNIQRLITYPSHSLIRKNILDKLIEASRLEIDEVKRKKLKEHSIAGKDDAFYMITFYKVIDSDNSLKRKGENVRFNGVFWTSTADIFLINICFYFIYCIWFKEIPYFATYENLFLYFAYTGLVLHIISVIKHINLSNKQLNSIIKVASLAEIVKTEFNQYLSE